MVRLTDRPDMTLDVYRGRKTTMQQCNNWPFYKPINRGTICVKVFPEVIQPVKGNNCGLIPIRPSFGFRIQTLPFNLFLHLSRTYSGNMRSVTYTVKI